MSRSMLSIAATTSHTDHGRLADAADVSQSTHNLAKSTNQPPPKQFHLSDSDDDGLISQEDLTSVGDDIVPIDDDLFGVERRTTLVQPAPIVRPLSMAGKPVNSRLANATRSTSNLPTMRANMQRQNSYGQLAANRQSRNAAGELVSYVGCVYCPFPICRDHTLPISGRNGATANGHSQDDDSSRTTVNMPPPRTSHAPPPQTSAGQKKSATVQEIERLERQREERRAAQEQQRMHKEQLKNADPGNKNWEFLAMIK